MALPGTLVELVLAQSRVLVRQRAKRSVERGWKRHQTTQVQSRNVQAFDWNVFSIVPSKKEPESKELIKEFDPKSKQTSLEENLEELKNLALQYDPEVTTSSELSDAELQSIYKDILSVPDTLGVPSIQTEQNLVEDNAEIRELPHELITKLYDRLIGEEQTEGSSRTPDTMTEGSLRASLTTVISAIRDRISAIERTRRDFDEPKKTVVPVMVLTFQEWRDLVYACIELKTFEDLECTLHLLRRFHGQNAEILLELIDIALEHAAREGYTPMFQKLVRKYCTTELTERQCDLVIKAHLHSGQVGPAMTYLHALESKATPASLKAYTMVIGRLAFPIENDNHSPDYNLSSSPISTTTSFSTTSTDSKSKRPSYARLHARAWDLLAHMRYVAHPNPDIPLYTLAIQMCAHHPLGRVEPERALDLWYELTYDSKLVPIAETYNALILVLARASRTTPDGRWAHEAWRVAREMLDHSRDAEGRRFDHLAPTQGTFECLLELCKRTGDLGRCRWIMSEMVKDEKVSNLAMGHVFHCYAAYKPRNVKREEIALVKGGRGGSELNGDEKQDGQAQAKKSTEKVEPFATEQLYHQAPQTSKEIIKEADALFEALLTGTSSSSTTSPSSSPSPPKNRFAGIPLTSDLISAYLSVHSSHAPFEGFSTIWLQTWQRVAPFGIFPNSRAYVLGMERCSWAGRDRTGLKRSRALRVAKVFMKDWVRYERGMYGSEKHKMTSAEARRVERVWSSYLRILALNDRTDDALQAVSQFTKRYPPKEIREPPSLEAYDSTRPVLLSNRPLVRLSIPHEIGDDTVPPILEFKDVETLHHRLVTKGDMKGVKFLSFVLSSYRGSLRMRREKALKDVPPSHPSVSVESITPPKVRQIASASA